MKIVLDSHNLSSSMTEAIRSNFFTTKKETAEHYKDYLFFTDLNAWWVPRDPNNRKTMEVISKIKAFYGK